MATPPKPTKAQLAAITLLAKGSAYRSTRAFANNTIIADGGHITAATAATLVRNGWATYGREAGLKKPFLLTDAGRAHLPSGDRAAYE
jgi:hypothetical protein